MQWGAETQNNNMSSVVYVSSILKVSWHPVWKKKKSQTRSLSFALLQMAISQNRWVVNANVPHAVRKVLREKNGHFPQLALPSILPLRADGCWCLCRACPGFTRCFNCCNELHFAHQFHSICATGDNEMAMCWRGAQQTTTLRPTTVWVSACVWIW